MKPEQFEALVKEFQEKEEKIMNWKAGEYSDEADRLMNFRQIAQITKLKMSEIALIYLLKHIQSITLAVINGNVVWEWEGKSGEGTKQRIADSRNYLLLLAACIEEEQDEEKYAEFVLMTEEEHQKLIERFGEAAVNRMIEILDNYKGAKGKTYKSDYRAILNWVVKRYEEEEGCEPNGRPQKPKDLAGKYRKFVS